uniref:Uncharacterized protein n=1 Tax=Rhizophora mucronata TaxID=61149 RepID=A0A2P2Q185_RHIMU
MTPESAMCVACRKSDFSNEYTTRQWF